MVARLDSGASVPLSADPLFLLDRASLTPTRARRVSLALASLAQGTRAEDLAVLPHLHAAISVLKRTPISAVPHSATDGLASGDDGDSRAKLDVSVTLLAWHDSGLESGHVLTCLTAILENAALDPQRTGQVERGYIARFSQMIRGALSGGPDAPLLALVAGADGVRGLVECVDDNLAKSKGVHISFARLWKQWLRNRLIGWVEGEPSRLAHLFETTAPLVPDPDALAVDLDFQVGVDADDRPAVPSVAVGDEEFAGLAEDAVHNRATALQFLRGSAYGGLSLSSDHYVPDELVRAVAKGAIGAADRRLAAGLVQGAEDLLSLALIVATGLREIDLQDLIWGAERQSEILLDIERPLLSVPLKRPANAVNPVGLGSKLQPVASRFVWPVPPSLHDALRKLSVAPRVPVAGSCVLPNAARHGKPSTSLAGLISEMAPGIQCGATRIRMALATKLSERFGPEVAQLSLRDSLFTTLGPAYYCSIAVNEIAEYIADIQSGWFGEKVVAPDNAGFALGSRLALCNDAAKAWASCLRKRIYATERRKDAASELLHAERDRLAGALCAATGNRPGNSLGALYLDSVVPEYALVILQDKQEDPLRRTRVAATGNHWVSALRAYLDRLVVLAGDSDSQQAVWARDVLGSVQPLFSLPSAIGGPTPLDSATLHASMPAEFVAVDNFYRHRLNQLLQTRHIDWELRHAQLGWVVSPAFALADMSPISPRILAERLGPVIDQVLVQDGWYPAHGRISKWTWDGIPMPPLADWRARTVEYEREHEAASRSLRQAFELRGKDAEAKVLAGLARGVKACLPQLKLDVDGRRLNAADANKPHHPVQLTHDHYALLSDFVRRDLGEQFTAVDRLACERLVNELVVRAIRDNVVVGPEPRYHLVGFTSQLSPFLPALGLAVRQVAAIREKMIEIAARDRACDRAGLVQLGLLTDTPYRDLDRARLLMKGSPNAVRGKSHPGWIRVPARDRQGEMPAVLSGVAGVALARCGKRSPTMRPLSDNDFGKWLAGALEGIVPLPNDKPDLAQLVAASCRVAGLVELDGPGRLILDAYPQATVKTTRELAENENWPVSTSVKSNTDSEPTMVTKDPSPDTSKRTGLSDGSLYPRLRKVLNSSSYTETKRCKTSSRRGLHQRMVRDLQVLVGEIEPTSNLGLIARYALHLAQFGGRRVKRLAEGTLYKEITRFGQDLLAQAGKRSLLGLPSEGIEAIYLSVLCGKTVDERPDVLEELVKFQRYLELAHHAASVEFMRLRTFVGPRIRRADKGVVTRPEVERILAELEVDVAREKQRPDTSPAAIRVCELRVIMFLILETSGLRPRSVRGLLLGDVHFLGTGRDFVHVHTSGGYGSAKTSTSKGFIPCDGDFWPSHRDRVIDWIGYEKAQLGEDWWKMPLFGEATGSSRCFTQKYLTSRITQLVKWVTGLSRGRTYWLRKRRMTQRLRKVLEDPAPTARAVYRVLHASGESDFLVPLSNYIHDAAVPLGTYLATVGRPDRERTLAVIGMRASQLDMRWHKRRGTAREFFYGAAFDALAIGFVPPPPELLTEPPILYRQRPLVPAHIDHYARMLQHFGDRTEAMIRCGLSELQTDRLDEAARDLVLRNGSVPWMIPGIRQAAAVMRAARRLSQAKKLVGLLDRPPESWLQVLAEAWARSGGIERMYDSDVVVVLNGATEADAAKLLLEKTGIDLEHQMEGHFGVLRAPREAAPGRRAHRNAPASALRWVLMIIWLYASVTGSTGLASGGSGSSKD